MALTQSCLAQTCCSITTWQHFAGLEKDSKMEELQWWQSVPSVYLLPHSSVTLTLPGHRIMEQFGWEGTTKPPLPPAQAAPSPIQPGLGHCQGWGTHSSWGQPAPGLTALTVTDFEYLT